MGIVLVMLRQIAFLVALGTVASACSSGDGSSSSANDSGCQGQVQQKGDWCEHACKTQAEFDACYIKDAWYPCGPSAQWRAGINTTYCQSGPAPYVCCLGGETPP